MADFPSATDAVSGVDSAAVRCRIGRPGMVVSRSRTDQAMNEISFATPEIAASRQRGIPADEGELWQTLRLDAERAAAGEEMLFALIRSGNTLTLKTEKQKDGEEAKPMSLELAQVRLADGNTSLVVRSMKSGTSGSVA